MGLFDKLREETISKGREWVPSDPHKSSSFEGKEHYDVYHVDKDGQRDQSHENDLKITGRPHEPSMTDIHKPKK